MLHNPVNRWGAVFAGAIGTALGAGVILTRSITVVAPSIIEDYGWSRSFIASCIALFMFASGIGLAVFGRHVSRYGIRAPSIIYLVVFGVILAALGLLPPSQPLFLAAFVGLGLAGAAGCAMPYVIAICATFTAKRGMALGLMSTGGALFGALLPSLTAWLLAEYGWRQGLVMIAVLSSVIPIACLALFVRTPPGVVEPRRKSADRERVPERAYLKDRVFWLLFIAIFGISVAGIGLTANLVPLLEDRGLSTAEAAWVLSLTGLTAWMGRPICGWALDRLFAPYVAAGVFAVAAMGTFLILVGGVGAGVYLGVIAVGMCLGGEADLLTYLTSRYFPIALVSKVVGVLWLAWAWGGGVGAFIAGLSYDLSGSYAVGVWIYEAMLLVAIVAVLILPGYRVAHEEEREVASGGDVGHEAVSV